MLYEVTVSFPSADRRQIRFRFEVIAAHVIAALDGAMRDPLVSTLAFAGSIKCEARFIGARPAEAGAPKCRLLETIAETTKCNT